MRLAAWAICCKMRTQKGHAKPHGLGAGQLPLGYLDLDMDISLVTFFQQLCDNNQNLVGLTQNSEPTAMWTDGDKGNTHPGQLSN